VVELIVSTIGETKTKAAEERRGPNIFFGLRRLFRRFCFPHRVQRGKNTPKFEISFIAQRTTDTRTFAL
jgi:hypothetical protein